MSFIIKGIDLPKKAELFINGEMEGEPPTVFTIYNDGRVLKMEHHQWLITDFEAIQIPKGARLIDANLEDEEKEVPFKEVVKDYITTTYEDINNL